MAVYKRGNMWWYEFIFNGARIQESAHTSSKTIAKQPELQRRRELEMGINRIPKRERTPLFKVAAERWLASKSGISRYTELHYRQYVHSLTERFGERLVCDITTDDIAELQRHREQEGKSGRTSNAELGVLRQILKRYKLWNTLCEDNSVKFKRERHDIGRAISQEDEEKLFDAIRRSRSPALLPLFVMALDTGLHASELRHLRHRDLRMTWANGAIESGELVVSRSKTEGGTGRSVPLQRRTCAVLTLWLARFPVAKPEVYVFPHHRIGFAGDSRATYLYAIDPTRSMGEWKSAWNVAREAAGVDYRWHDLRHSFISRLAENPKVSEQTITALAGHVSKRMLERYSHIRAQAKRDAIATLERPTEGSQKTEIGQPPLQKSLQSADRDEPLPN